MRLPVGILGALALAAFGLGGCGAGPRGRVVAAVEADDIDGALEAYDELREREGGDADLLGRVAARILDREVHAEEDAVRSAALTQLGLAGTAGAPMLRELSQEPGVGPTRLGALVLLARRGDADARLALRSLADRDDPAILAAAVLGMDPELDRALLLEHARAEDVTLRAAAVRQLGAVAAVDEVREALSVIARTDAEAEVRAAAVGALRRAGETVTDVLRERLGDPAPNVRMAAVDALALADPGAARAALLSLLEISVSAEGIEAARLLATDEDEAAASPARSFLRRALASEDAGLRIQAGVALTGLPRDAEAPMDAVREALATESDESVRLAFARALHRREDAAGRRALEALLEGTPMTRVQAAALLGADDHEGARAVLAEVLADADEPSLTRRTAARALARDAMRPDAVRGALRDPDAFVRIFAAGGILAAAAAS
ncbi:MAG: HEAT repeat domain-containing protein [Sandaracinaceae bacterium]|nr:HEAT repeat domain-containing protein [Sandaracinaceae bacterium]